MTEYACIIRRSFWFSNGFIAWCGARYETSRPAGWFTPTCPACKRIKNGGK